MWDSDYNAESAGESIRLIGTKPGHDPEKCSVKTIH